MRDDNLTLVEVLEQMARKVGGVDLTPGDAYSSPHEQLLIRYVKGTGRFGEDATGKLFIAIDTQAYKLNGEWDGTYVGVDEPMFKSPAELFDRPAPPAPPFDSPSGPVTHVMPLSYSKGLRTFPDGSTLEAIGPANLHVVRYIDQEHQFWVTSNLIITHGTGRYAGARGLKTVAGSTWVERGKPITARDPFMVRTVEVYRVVLGDSMAA